MSSDPPIVGWRGLGLRLLGEMPLVGQVIAELPPFYLQQPTAFADAILTATDDTATLGLPDGLGYIGPIGAETTRAISSRVELCIVDRLPDFAVVHAGVVALNDQAVVLPGTSMAGKSTLVRALIDAGFDYLSDEYALISSAGAVHPYPRRMTIRTAEGTRRSMPGRAWDVNARAATCALVAQLRYGADSPRIDEVSSATGMLGLVANAVNGRRNPELVMQALAALATSARCVQGDRGEAVETAQELRALLAEAKCHTIRGAPPGDT